MARMVLQSLFPANATLQFDVELLSWTSIKGLVLRTYVRMVGYLRKFSRKDRNGRIQRTLMKCLLIKSY
ncbi:hypothetical protein CIPAW_13G088200 [Carya illinoinensis]|uniref:Uncharacterized protein n=1 Tax=Carya illinoinensis TaxID=32201 RepID=A0A8T1NHP1_CARIL|nr:hypothetical protein CIPAW_13G088200 [Carya illinoinensis]